MPTTLCPSARPVDDMPGGLAVFAVAAGTPEEPSAEYLPEAIPITAAMLETMARGPIEVGEVFRFTKQCREEACRQWDEKAHACSLIDRWVAALDVPAETALPRCAIRQNCRAWHQLGARACRSCHRVTSQWITGLDEPLAKVDLEKLYL
jgi:hypothetical protein